MPTTFHHSLTPHFHTMARTGWRGGKRLSLSWFPAYSGQVLGMGMTPHISENASSYLYDADAGGPYLEALSGAVENDDSYISTIQSYFNFVPKANLYMTVRFSLPVITNTRFLTGLIPYGNRASVTGSDDPSQSMIGLQFSTGRGDTNFQFIHSDASTMVLVDTGVAPATDVIYQWEMEYSGGGMALRGRLSDHTGAVLMADTSHTATEAQFTTNEEVSVSAFIGEDTLTTADAKFRFYRTEVWL